MDPAACETSDEVEDVVRFMRERNVGFVEDARRSLTEVHEATGGKRMLKETRSPPNGVEFGHHEFTPIIKSSIPVLKTHCTYPTLDME